MHPQFENNHPTARQLHIRVRGLAYGNEAAWLVWPQGSLKPTEPRVAAVFTSSYGCCIDIESTEETKDERNICNGLKRLEKGSANVPRMLL
jgi:hypothetical protein